MAPPTKTQAGPQSAAHSASEALQADQAAEQNTDPAAERSTGDRLAELENRVARLENRTANRVAGPDRRTQDEIDDEILSRRPNSYQEAVLYEAARKRRGETEAKADDETDDKPAGKSTKPATDGK
jgi:hypothetical protein